MKIVNKNSRFLKLSKEILFVFEKKKYPTLKISYIFGELSLHNAENIILKACITAIQNKYFFKPWNNYDKTNSNLFKIDGFKFFSKKISKNICMIKYLCIGKFGGSRVFVHRLCSFRTWM